MRPPSRIDQIQFSWACNMSVGVFVLLENHASVGGILVSAESATRRNTSATTAEFEAFKKVMDPHSATEVCPVALLKAVLPPDNQTSWDPALYVALGKLEVRGTASGIKLCVRVRSPSGMRAPTDNEKIEALAYLESLKKLAVS